MNLLGVAASHILAIERPAEHVSTRFAPPMNERWVAGLTDNPRAMTSAFRAHV